jgi:site-specific recombinase XerD
MARAGVKRHAYDGVSGHALRHTAASDVLDECKDLRAVQQMLGHAQLSTTAIYLRRVSAESLRTAMGGRTYGRAA